MISVRTSKSHKCVLCGGNTGGRNKIAWERSSSVSKMRWEYPLCDECFERLRKHLEEVSKDVGDKWCDSVQS